MEILYENLYDKVIVISTYYRGKGGIAILISKYLELFPTIRYIPSHKFTNVVNQFLIAIVAIIRLAYLCIFKKSKIVHIHTASYRSFYRDSIYLVLAKFFRKKVILHIHGGEFEKFYLQNKRYCDFICHRADCIVAVSKYFGKIFRQYKLNDRVEVIYNSADKPIYQRGNNKDKGLNILFLGTIDDNKGIFDLIYCFIDNYEFLQGKVTLNICGVGDSLRLSKLIKDNFLSDMVIYHGWVDIIRKNELLSMADIYVQPSYFESLGIAIIEAMGYGLPIVASNTGGIPELVQDGKNGILIEPGNKDNLFNALSKLIEDPVLREKMGNESLKTSRLFTHNCMKDKIINLYNSLM